MKTALLTAALASGFATATMAQDFKWQAFYTQTYENVAQVGDVWTSPNNQGGLSIETDEAGNHYVQYNQGNNNSRGLYNLDALTEEMYEGISEFRVEFDLALTSGTNQFTTFAVGSPDIKTQNKNWDGPATNITSYPNNGLYSGALLALIQETQNSTLWRVYSQGQVGINSWIDVEDETKAMYVNLEAGVFYHFAITVTPHEATEAEGWNVNITTEIKDMDGNTVTFSNPLTEEAVESLTLPYTTEESEQYWFKQFYVLSGRYNSVMKIDNIQVMKKVEAGSVTPPSLSMTAVKLDGRVVALDNGMEADALIPYYTVVDEATYDAATSAEGLTGTEYTEPFVVSGEMNYILAWNVNEAGKASELTKFIVEAGWAPQLNAPTITATDYNGYKKTFVATCDQSNILPLSPLSYTIYMSADSINWEATNTYTVRSGKVYAKVEADGYLPAGCEPAEAPEGAYGSTKWTVAGMVITSETCPLYNFDNSGKGRVHVPVQYWSEDYVGEDGTTYDAENAWAPLKRFHINGGNGDMFILGSGNASGFTVTGITVYNNNKSTISIENLTEGDIIQVKYADGSAQILTVDDPETFTVPIPKYGGAALATIEIKGAGTIETRDVKAGEWGILVSSRTVADTEQSGAAFYEHAYTIYNDQQVADTLLLKPVDALKAGYAYVYKAAADQIELVTLAAEEPMDEQDDEQADAEMWTLGAVLDDSGYEDEGLYTMQPGGILMNNEKMMTIPMGQGYFTGLAMPENYIEELDYKLNDEFAALAEAVNAAVNKAVEDWKSSGYYDEEGNWWYDHEGDMSDEEYSALYEKTYKEKYNELIGKYVAIPVLHSFDQNIADVIQKVDANALVNVVTPSGIVVRRGVKASEALSGLKSGLYIVGSKKIAK